LYGINKGELGPTFGPIGLITGGGAVMAHGGGIVINPPP
jgi:hypothetical protein